MGEKWYFRYMRLPDTYLLKHLRRFSSLPNKLNIYNVSPFRAVSDTYDISMNKGKHFSLGNTENTRQEKGVMAGLSTPREPTSHDGK